MDPVDQIADLGAAEDHDDDVPESKPARSRKKPTVDTDPDKPRPPRPAFMEFLNDQREPLLAENPALATNVREIAKIIGEKWRTLSAEERDRYKQEFANKKKAHEIDLAAYYEANPGAKERDDGAARDKKVATAAKRQREAEKKGKKAKRDTSGPKRAMSAFFWYSSKMRSTVKGDLPEGAKPTEVTKAIATRWKSLTDDEKKEYIRLADDDKNRYHRECEETGYIPPSKRAKRARVAAAAAAAAHDEADEEDLEEDLEDEAEGELA